MLERSCACKCRCGLTRARDCNDLCAECWSDWCLGSEKHAPVADRSYMGTYGITGAWAGRMMSRGASQLLAEPAAFLQRPEVAPPCPSGCDNRMVRRLGTWKCYRHPEPVVIQIEDRFPRSPQVSVPWSPRSGSK